MVNKGNLGALQEITDEAYAAVAGRAGSFVDLIPRLAEFTAALDAQTNDIIATAEGLNRVAATLAAHKDSLSRAIDSLPAALKVLNDNRKNIIDTFAALQSFATVASHILSETKEDIAADFKDLYAVIKPINDNRADFVSDLDLLPTFPFTTQVPATSRPRRLPQRVRHVRPHRAPPRRDDLHHVEASTRTCSISTRSSIRPTGWSGRSRT